MGIDESWQSYEEGNPPGGLVLLWVWRDDENRPTLITAMKKKVGNISIWFWDKTERPLLDMLGNYTIQKWQKWPPAK